MGNCKVRGSHGLGFGKLCTRTAVPPNRIFVLAEGDNDNDNDNDTLREVPHPSNEGLALQARVSGPWPHKKESVLLVELARWQSVQTQTVNGQSAMQQVLR